MSNHLDRIKSELDAADSRERLTQLFCEVLHWGNPGGLPSRRVDLGAPINLSLTLEPVAQLSGLPVYCIMWPDDRLPGITARRAVQRALKPIHAEHLVCYITQNPRQLAFTWARQRFDGKIELRTLPYEVGSPARTTIERLSHLCFSPEELEHGQPSITAVTDKLNRAFDVEAVTRKFFEDYKKVFDNLQKRLTAATGDKVWAHDYALQLLNRLMFIYFIQRKRWLGDNPNFLADFWNAYKASRQPADTFFDRWLSVLFFEAFNNRFHGGHQHFPENIREALQLAPYLNGGLFARNQLDHANGVTLPDEFFATLFDVFEGSRPGFLERYNFTIAESTPLDIEVAVDPEMIGKVYESLVNITTEGIAEDDQRGTAGIFYTARVEIDLMCRLALVDSLANRLGTDKKPLLYDAIFAYEHAEKEAADDALAKHDLWPELNRLLRETTICDPACGSGSFLVGMLLVLDDLQARANARLGIEESPYERRRRIIGEQLYGVDVMPWAVHIAELRLWLQLVVETQLDTAQRKFQPLLPNLSFKVRCGDSLVQEIGGINFGLHRTGFDISQKFKARITQLQQKKLLFYQGTRGLREADLKKEELDLFRDILAEKLKRLEDELKEMRRQIAQGTSQCEEPEGESDLAGGMAAPPAEQRRRFEQLRNECKAKEAELEQMEAALGKLTSEQQIPFVWDIAFVEIFKGDRGGFDIVIGNPPYVRQEMIAPPRLDPDHFGGRSSELWKKQKMDYKAKLQQSVAAAWPQFFRHKPGRADFRKLDGKSDLYIYFYFIGLALLNSQGTLCFITSNSWLDVGYGADLQEFLLKHSHVKFILDNERKRSFAQADVNTIIALLGAPDDRKESGLEKTARFVMFKVPFEEVVDADTFKELESATERKTCHRWRINVVSQRTLLEEGGLPVKDDLLGGIRYQGNKWGGKYLRAPDIFFTILKKGKGKLVRLGDIAEVRFGIKTGANEFFYLDEEKIRQWGIEPEFLHPVIKSPRECRSIVINPQDLKYKIFMCHKDKRELQGTAALEYIKWGESQGFHLRPSCRGRQRWWDVGMHRPPQIVSPSSTNDLYRVFTNEANVLIDKRLYEIFVQQHGVMPLATVLNSTLTTLFLEIGSRTGLGEGLLDLTVYEVAACLIANPVLVRRFPLPARAVLPFEEELRQPDRRALDDVVFEALGLTAGEREAVYEAVIELVRARLEKAQSV